MPVVTIGAITRPEHLVEYLAQVIEGSELGIQSVLKYDDQLINEYPAVQIFAAPFAKELHGTHTFLVTLRADIYLMHAKLTLDRQTRNYEDLALATQLVALLESDPNLFGSNVDVDGRKVIAGWVEAEKPGIMPPRSSKQSAVVSTLLQWQGINETRF